VPPSSNRESTRHTVLIAGAANIVVTVAKLAAGLISGSSAMLAEAAHSAADTLNQAFLLTSVHKSGRPADSGHPFGYGQERYFWSLLAAFGIFIAGAGFSVFEGLLALFHSSSGNHGSTIAYIVLGVSAIAEGTSLLRAYHQVHGEAKQRGSKLLPYLRNSPDTTVKAALLEDSAALVGLILAAAGIILRQLTGSSVWDGSASIAIGALLVVVAVRLGLDNRDLLIGRAASPEQLGVIRDEIERTRGVGELLELLTMQLGPDHLIVAARVTLDDEVSADDVENLADGIDKRLRERLPLVPHVFIDPTQQPAPRAARPAGGPPEAAGREASGRT
jgi:cation diffusion facilitator family transporter